MNASIFLLYIYRSKNLDIIPVCQRIVEALNTVEQQQINT